MEQKERYTLGKAERLKSRKAIDLLFKEGKALSVFPVKIIYKVTASQIPGLQAAFSVSKRHFKKATDRNRIKRLLREAWRLQKNEWQKTLEQNNQQAVVFILFTGNELPAYELVVEKIKAALKKLQRITNEETAGHS